MSVSVSASHYESGNDPREGVGVTPQRTRMRRDQIPR